MRASRLNWAGHGLCKLSRSLILLSSKLGRTELHPLVSAHVIPPLQLSTEKLWIDRPYAKDDQDITDIALGTSDLSTFGTVTCTPVLRATLDDQPTWNCYMHTRPRSDSGRSAHKARDFLRSQAQRYLDIAWSRLSQRPFWLASVRRGLAKPWPVVSTTSHHLPVRYKGLAVEDLWARADAFLSSRIGLCLKCVEGCVCTILSGSRAMHCDKHTLTDTGALYPDDSSLLRNLMKLCGLWIFLRKSMLWTSVQSHHTGSTVI